MRTLLAFFILATLGLALFGLINHLIGRAYEGSRQAQCMNNMGMTLGRAHLQFSQTHNHFCGYVNSIGPDHKTVSWVVPLFSYLDRQDLANAWTSLSYDWENSGQTIPAKLKHPNALISVLLCPTNPPRVEKNSPLSYVVNGGYGLDVPPECANPDCQELLAGSGENPANGIFHDHYGPVSPGNPATKGFRPEFSRLVTFDYLAKHDGASRTLLLSENVQLVKTWYTTVEDRKRLAMLWWDEADTPATSYRRINYGKTAPIHTIQAPTTEADFARPSSFHVGGVNVAFADGHGKFVSEEIDYKVYKQLMTTAGQDSADQDNILLDESSY